jgi:cytochrome subunit of sulfide dehydrogenase
VRACLATTLVSAAANALADDVVVRDAAASCLACHQPVAQALPMLHGQARDALVAKLRAFRDGSRTGTVMPQLVKGYSETELDAIAAWFAAQRTPQ